MLSEERVLCVGGVLSEESGGVFEQKGLPASRGFFDAKTSSETLRKRNGSFPSVKSDSPIVEGPREAQPPVSGMSKHSSWKARGLF